VDRYRQATAFHERLVGPPKSEVADLMASALPLIKA